MTETTESERNRNLRGIESVHSQIAACNIVQLHVSAHACVCINIYALHVRETFN